MNLHDQLKAFDGKHTAVLERIGDSLLQNDISVAQLIAISAQNDTRLQVAATWILKRWHEEGLPQINSAVASLIRLLEDSTYWEVQLHLLQMLTTLPIPTRSVPSLGKVLHRLMTNQNKFVRAWAISSYAALADQNVSLQKEVKSVLTNAGEDDAASVRARARQIRRKYRWAAQDGSTRQ